jgi:Family of unknown function (DUF6223)
MNARIFDFQAAQVGVTTLSSGRIGAMVAVVTGLVGLVIGGVALRTGPGHHDTAGKGAVVALVAGCVGMALGGLVVATAGGGLGTGHGLGGGIVALVVGFFSLVLGGLARRRTLQC